MRSRCVGVVLLIAVVTTATQAVAAYRIPSVSAISPTAVYAGSGNFTLTVSGKNFNLADAITWNGNKLPTTLLGGTQAQAVVPAAALTSAGTANVGMWDSRTGRYSNTLTFTITQPGTSPTPPAIAVSVSPTSTSLAGGASQQFTAAVTNTTNTSVTWSATGGTVSSSGFYTAPTTAGTYTVTAKSMADPTKSASAIVAIAAVSVSISPNYTTVVTGGNVQFAAAVTGTTNTAVTWAVASGGGTVSNTGLYTAPTTAGTSTVVASSVADNRASALANITVSAPVSVLLSASPTSLSFGSVLVGTTVGKLLTLSNTGNSSVTISSATMTGSGFSVTGLTFPFTLAAGGSQTANVAFAPSTTGTATGSVSFVSNATNSPATVSLSGSGTAALQHTVTLSWQTSTTTITGYNVYRSATSGSGYARLNSTPAPTASYADSTVQSGQTYYYVVTVLDGSGIESGYSNEVGAFIPTP